MDRNSATIDRLMNRFRGELPGHVCDGIERQLREAAEQIGEQDVLVPIEDIGVVTLKGRGPTLVQRLRRALK